jgi:hypothetical protein
MKKVLSILLVATMFATPVSRVALLVSLWLGWLVWNESSKTMSAQRKLKPIRIPASTRKVETPRRN